MSSKRIFSKAIFLDVLLGIYLIFSLNPLAVADSMGYDEASGLFTSYATFYSHNCTKENPCNMHNGMSTATQITTTSDVLVTAMDNYAKSGAHLGLNGLGPVLAGAWLEVRCTSTGKVTYVLVTDENGMDKGALDLCSRAYDMIAPVPNGGKIPITWSIVKRPVSGGLEYFSISKSGSPVEWLALQIRNHPWPIKIVEYKDETGAFVKVDRQVNNTFNFSIPKGLVGKPMTYRVTYINGTSVVDSEIDLNKTDSVFGKSSGNEGKDITRKLSENSNTPDVSPANKVSTPPTILIPTPTQTPTPTSEDPETSAPSLEDLKINTAFSAASETSTSAPADVDGRSIIQKFIALLKKLLKLFLKLLAI